MITVRHWEGGGDFRIALGVVMGVREEMHDSVV